VRLTIAKDREGQVGAEGDVAAVARFTPGEVQKKYDLSPEQYPDFAALRGDPSDNLPGIPGVGEKTAAKWIREYGSLRELIERIDTVKGKVGEKLREHLSSVLQNRRLTELDRAVPALPLIAAGYLLPNLDRLPRLLRGELVET